MKNNIFIEFIHVILCSKKGLAISITKFFIYFFPRPIQIYVGPRPYIGTNAQIHYGLDGDAWMQL